jgi:phosphatidylinositol-bisphosphatase
MVKSQLSFKNLNNLVNDSDILEYDDGRTYNPKAVRVITQEWVDKHMKDREAQFTETINNYIFCGTWNVNAKKEEMDLHDWLLPKDENNNKTTVSDVYAIGFQEMVDLNAMNVALDSSKSQHRSQFWQDKIMECLSSTGIKFSFIMGKHLVGLYLCICAKESLVKDIHDVRATSAGVGIMGMLGNKGGVSIRMSIFDSSVCFVCSHLAAHRGAVSSRNEDFKNIVEKSVFETEEEEDIIHHHSNKINNNINNNSKEAIFPNTSNNQFDNDVVSDNVVRPRNGAEKTKGEDLTIMDHELIFWSGDLNYRIDEEISLEEVYANISSKDLTYLRSKDQLNIEREKNAAFQNFHEGVLEFTPTYKYQPGTNIYDQR